MTYFVYLVQCNDNSFYCGYTTNLNKRLLDHNNTKKGSKYTRTRRPVTLKYYEVFNNLGEALKKEYFLKKLSHEAKWQMVKNSNV